MTNNANLRKLFWAGGLVAGILLIVAGAIWIWQGVDARNEVKDTIAQEQITGTPDMKPADIPPEIAALFDEPVTCDVAEEPITTGAEARCFAQYMRVHALEGTGGRTFSEMGRYLKEDGSETSNPDEAAKNPETGQPVTNAARETWVSQRALATGLELAFVGEQISLFSIAMGALLVVVGIGFLVMLTVGGVLSQRGQRAGPSGESSSS